MCLPIFTQRATSMLDDLAELWWKGEHEARACAVLEPAHRGARRARARAKKLADRTADTLGDQAVLEGETKRLDLPEGSPSVARTTISRRRAEAIEQGWWNVGGATICAIFAAGARPSPTSATAARRAFAAAYEVLTEEHTLPAPRPTR